MTNQNTTEYLHKIRQRLFENLRMLPHAPGVQMAGELNSNNKKGFFCARCRFCINFKCVVSWLVRSIYPPDSWNNVIDI